MYVWPIAELSSKPMNRVRLVCHFSGNILCVYNKMKILQDALPLYTKSTYDRHYFFEKIYIQDPDTNTIVNS